jgi:EmrB/QacA subfamily drug resistance transporter
MTHSLPQKWLALPIVLAGVFLVTLDFFIVNVAIPSTQLQLEATSGQVQWWIAGYGLAFAALLITGGRIGDRLGRRRAFVAGLAGFTVASAACGLAPSAGALIAARVVQGAAGALLLPQVLAIIGVAYDGQDRVRAFVFYALTQGLAAVGGQLIGGALLEADVAGLGWRACFLVNVPIGIAALLLAPRWVPESRSPQRARFDLTGNALVTAGLVAVVLPLVQGREQGWPLWTWISLAAGLELLIAFAVHQRRLERRGGAPLVPPALFREPGFARGLVTVGVFYAGVASFFLVLALHLQEHEGMGALESGALFAIMGGGYLVTTFTGPALGRAGLVGGGVVLALGLVVIAEALVPGLLISGLGLGMVMGPLLTSVLAGMRPESAGAATGVLATSQQVGNALGVAIIGLVYYGDGDGGWTASLDYLVLCALATAVLLGTAAIRRSTAGTPAQTPAT